MNETDLLLRARERVKSFYWQCENCQYRDDPSICGKPTVCPQCGWNRWKQVEVSAAPPLDTAQDFAEVLRQEFSDPEYATAYAESFLDAYIATQIKVLREQRGWTQEQLAEKIGTAQPGISRLEDVNYSAWSVSTLTKLAAAFSLRLKITFEDFSGIASEVQCSGSSMTASPISATRTCR